MEQTKITIGSISLKGGGREDLVCLILQYYPTLGRSVVKGLLHFNSEHTPENDNAIIKWACDHQVQELIVDLPLSSPLCERCQLSCPGQGRCPQPSVQEIRQQMNWLLAQDQAFHAQHPKAYEQKRVEHNLRDFQRSLFSPSHSELPLARAFKQKLKKGFLPYWHRPVDYWVWLHYYGPALKFFRHTYDSFGQVPGLLLQRFFYWRRHFPASLRCHESSVVLNLLELMRAKIIFPRDVRNLQTPEDHSAARLLLVREIEKHCKIFIYQNDIEELVENARAFDALLLVLGAPTLYQEQHQALPAWALPEECHFLVFNSGGSATN